MRKMWRGRCGEQRIELVALFGLALGVAGAACDGGGSHAVHDGSAAGANAGAGGGGTSGGGAGGGAGAAGTGGGGGSAGGGGTSAQTDGSTDGTPDAAGGAAGQDAAPEGGSDGGAGAAGGAPDAGSDGPASDAASDVGAAGQGGADAAAGAGADASPEVAADAPPEAPPIPTQGPARPAKVVGAGEYHTCAVRDDGKLKCWGYNSLGQLGIGNTNTMGDAPNEMGADLPFVDLGTGRTAKSVCGGNHHSCAILYYGKFKCWGDGSFGQLGGVNGTIGDGVGEMGDNLAYSEVGTGRTVQTITCGPVHTCALLDNGDVKCWGGYGNAYGEIGSGIQASIGLNKFEMGDALARVQLDGKVTVLSSSRYHNCVLLDTGKVKCWGENTQGQLGLGDKTNRGNASNQMGANLPALDLGTNRTAKAVVATMGGGCAILDNDTVKCWGIGGSGALGLGDTATHGDMAGQMGDNLPAIDLGTGRHAVALEGGCAILDNQQLKCWGENGGGLLGLGVLSSDSRGDMPNEMGDHLPAVDVGTGRTVVGLSHGEQHVCVVLDDKNVKCWGDNQLGQLGRGDTTFTWGDRPYEMGDYLIRIDLGP
jgi:alpha-tubulin suppressor-like RCC1 family protein